MDTVNLFTNPSWLITTTAFPIALVMILGFIASGTFGNTVSAYDYYGVAMFTYGIFNAATFSANSFMEERIKKANMRIVYSPIRPFYIHFSKVVATTIFCSAMYVLVAAFLTVVLNVNYGGSSAWLLLGVMLLSLFAFSALGVAVCCLLKSESSANSFVSVLITIFCVSGGAFFPVEGLGPQVTALSWVSPAKWIISCSFQIIYDDNFSLLLPTIVVLTVITLVSILISVKTFKGEDYI
jgi:ABC-2 type transport system permease protein